MLIACLFLTFAVLWWGTFCLFDRDMVCPAMLFISGYALSVAVAFVSDFALPFDYHWATYGVLVAGVLLFLIPAYLFKQGYSPSIRRLSAPRVTIEFSGWALWLHAGLCFCTAVATVLTYVQVLSGLGVEIETTFSAITAMRNYGIEHPEGTGSPLLLFVSQAKKVFLVTGYFLLLVWARNCAVKQRFGDDKLLLFNCLCCGALILTEGGRGGLVAYVLAGAVLYFIFNRLMNGARVRFTMKGTLAGAVVFSVGCMGFYGMLWVSGRTSGEFDLAGVWHHTSFYLGGSVPLLDNFLETYSIGGVLISLEKKRSIQQCNNCTGWD